ncbi:MAG TPA: hypothetical protein VFK05_34155 [Polyangiaceae bacterium]|nr:hypothetical protein [Polyangiaceae bacterium]
MRRLFSSATCCFLAAGSCALAACSAQSAKPNDSAATAGSGNTVGCRATDADVYAPGIAKPGAAGNFEFTLLSSTPAPPALNDNRFVVQVSDADGNAVDGHLSVALDMPEHGHSSPTQPTISFDGEQNAFVLEPMRLFMVGLWRFTFDFETSVGSASLADSAVFEFCVD